MCGVSIELPLPLFLDLLSNQSLLFLQLSGALFSQAGNLHRHTRTHTHKDRIQSTIIVYCRHMPCQHAPAHKSCLHNTSTHTQCYRNFFKSDQNRSALCTMRNHMNCSNPKPSLLIRNTATYCLSTNQASTYLNSNHAPASENDQKISLCRHVKNFIHYSPL